MSRMVWAFGWVTVAIWSLVCAAAYGLFDLVGRTLMRNADAFSGDANVVEGVWRFLSFLHGASTGAVLVVWAIVSLLILAVPWAFDRMLGPAARGSVAPRPLGPATTIPPAGLGGGAVIDLGPDQYRVDPATARAEAAPRSSGSTPRIVPRG